MRRPRADRAFAAAALLLSAGGAGAVPAGGARPKAALAPDPPAPGPAGAPAAPAAPAAGAAQDLAAAFMQLSAHPFRNRSRLAAPASLSGAQLEHGSWPAAQLPALRGLAAGAADAAGDAASHARTLVLSDALAPALPSENRTAAMLRQMALESAILVAQLRSLAAQGAVGVPHVSPAMHVAGRGRLAPLAAAGAGARAGSPGGVHGGDLAWAGGAGPRAEQAVGLIHVLMAAAGVLVIGLASFLNSNRTALAMSVLQKGRPRHVRVAHKATNAALARGMAPSEHLEEQACRAMGMWDSTVAAFSCIVGTGLLAMPYAFSLAGTIAVPMLLLFVCCSAYTARLMCQSFVELGTFSLGQLAEAAFGRKARVATNAFLVVELWGYLLSSLVCGSMNVSQLAEGLDDGPYAVGVSVAIVFLLSFLPSGVMTRVNVASNAFFIVCCLMFIITGLLLPQKAPSADIRFVKPQGVIPAAGILIFSPAGHSFYPALMERMRNPAQFPVCLNRAYAAACALYLLVAVSGYCLFGNQTQPSAVMNIGSDLKLVPLPHLGWMSPVAALGMSVKMLALATLALVPLTSTIQRVLGGQKLSSEACSFVVTPCVLVVSAFVAAQFAHEMARLLNLLGSVFCMNIAFVLPVACYWKLAREPLGCARQFVFLSFIALGVSFACLGCLSAL